MNLYDDSKTGSSRGRSSSSRGRAQSSRGQAKGSSQRSSSQRSSSARGSASRQTSARRTAPGYSGGRRGRRRRSQKNYMGIAVGGVILILLILIAAFAMKSCGGEETGLSAETESQISGEVTVDGVSITGMSREEAREAILAGYSWGMTVDYEGDIYEVENLIGGEVDLLLDEIFSADKPQESYSLDTTGLDELIQTQVEAMAARWDKPARNGEISGFDKESNSFIYSGEETGVVIDQEKLAADIRQAMDGKDFDARITAVGHEVEPEITEAQAKEMYRVIGQYSTTTTANKDRNTNIKLASECLEGKIIQPGETFSFNDTTGPRSLEKGYKPAGAYVNGELVEEPGGGVCQVSSTLYNAVVFAGLKTTERHAHSYEPSYVTPGEDAAVSYGGPDMKFVNNSDTAVALRAKLEGSLSGKMTLTVSVVGIPILEDGVTYSMHSEKVSDLDPPEPEYVDDLTLEPHTEKVVTAARPGSRWTTNLVIKKDGEVISDELLHNSSYRGHAAVIHRNETDEQVLETSEGETESSATASSVEGEITPMETDGLPEDDGGLEASNAQTAESTESHVSTQAPSAPAAETASTEAPGPQGSPEPGNSVIAPHPQQTAATVENGPGV